ncbi:MAG: hypothetical protein RIK87_00700 [Fuerstiella sp.]
MFSERDNGTGTMIATRRETIWHMLTIPPGLEPWQTPTTRVLSLRFTDEGLRQTWELILDAYRTPKTLTAFLFIQPRNFRDDRTIDLQAVGELAVSLLTPRASLSRGDCFVHAQRFTRDNGSKVLRAMLEAVEGQIL